MMFLVFGKEINKADMIHMSFREIMLLISVAKSSSLEKGSLTNVSLGVHLVWLSRSLMIPPWVICPLPVVLWNIWGIRCRGMPHGVTIKILF
jgi:hypothetical protein